MQPRRGQKLVRLGAVRQNLGVAPWALFGGREGEGGGEGDSFQKKTKSRNDERETGDQRETPRGVLQNLAWYRGHYSRRREKRRKHGALFLERQDVMKPGPLGKGAEMAGQTREGAEESPPPPRFFFFFFLGGGV